MKVGVPAPVEEEDDLLLLLQGLPDGGAQRGESTAGSVPRVSGFVGRSIAQVHQRSVGMGRSSTRLVSVTRP